jgi:hypothetical protein
MCAVAAACAVLAVGLSAGPALGSAAAGSVAAGSAAAGSSAAGSATAGSAAQARTGAAAVSRARPVVIIGIPGLRWTDISAATTPALWRLAAAGSVGSLIVTAVQTRTCPADAWLTLNSGARSMAPRPASGSCPRLPRVVPAGTSKGAATAEAAGTPNAAAAGQARVPAMPALVGYNRQFHYQPDWGLLATAAGPGRCATAIGPGAALALASPAGRVGRYLPGPSSASQAVLSRCPLTVVDLGALPAGGRARTSALRAADQAAGRIIADAPAGAIIMVAGLGDGTQPHLRAVIVAGPGYSDGLLTSASTRRPGMTLITDLTPSVLSWRGRRIPSGVVGSQLRGTARGTAPGALAAAVRGLIGQDTAAQVYRSTITLFFLCYGLGEGILFGLLAVILRGSGEERTRRRRSAYRVAGVAAGAVPAGTFLAALVPWWQLPHPAIVLYALALAWAAVIAAVALAGPWRRDPLGPPGLVAAVTVAVIGIDVMTGSRLQLETPFGLSALVAGRFYGVGNNALGVYAVAGILCAAWAGVTALRAGSRRRAVAAAAAVALFAVVASGWPGFGDKVGGTIAMVPGFLLLLAAVADLKINLRRGLLIAVSGLVLVTGFALLNYFIPATGPSDIGAFVGQVLHGGAGGILQRKVSSNVHSLTETSYAPVVPVAVVALAAALAWPARLRLGSLAAGFRQLPLLRPILIAMWLVAVLGWLADDSGITVAAAALPLALPLVIAVLAGVPPVGGTVAGQPAASSQNDPVSGAL